MAGSSAAMSTNCQTTNRLRALAVIGGVAGVVMLLGIAVLALLVRAIQLVRL